MNSFWERSGSLRRMLLEVEIEDSEVEMVAP
jgi:hypothetical protein